MINYCENIRDNIAKKSDTELLLRVANKEEVAFLEVYHRYNRFIFNFVYLILKDHGETEEIMQEVFIQVWNKAARFNPDRAAFSTWIITIARNKALDRTRRLKYKQKTSDIEEQKIESDSEKSNIVILENKRNKLIRNAINKLPQKQKKVINVVYFEGFTHIEAAQKLNLPVGTVKTRLRLGITKLRNLIQKKTIENY